MTAITRDPVIENEDDKYEVRDTNDVKDGREEMQRRPRNRMR